MKTSTTSCRRYYRNTKEGAAHSAQGFRNTYIEEMMSELNLKTKQIPIQVLSGRQGREGHIRQKDQQEQKGKSIKTFSSLKLSGWVCFKARMRREVHLINRPIKKALQDIIRSKEFIQSVFFSYSFNKYLLSRYYLLCIILGIDKALSCPHEGVIGLGGDTVAVKGTGHTQLDNTNVSCRGLYIPQNKNVNTPHPSTQNKPMCVFGNDSRLMFPGLQKVQ